MNVVFSRSEDIFFIFYEFLLQPQNGWVFEARTGPGGPHVRRASRRRRPDCSDPRGLRPRGARAARRPRGARLRGRQARVAAARAHARAPPPGRAHRARGQHVALQRRLVPRAREARRRQGARPEQGQLLLQPARGRARHACRARGLPGQLPPQPLAGGGRAGWRAGAGGQAAWAAAARAGGGARSAPGSVRRRKSARVWAQHAGAPGRRHAQHAEGQGPAAVLLPAARG